MFASLTPAQPAGYAHACSTSGGRSRLLNQRGTLTPAQPAGDAHARPSSGATPLIELVEITSGWRSDAGRAGCHLHAVGAVEILDGRLDLGGALLAVPAKDLGHGVGEFGEYGRGHCADEGQIGSA